MHERLPALTGGRASVLNAEDLGLLRSAAQFSPPKRGRGRPSAAAIAAAAAAQAALAAHASGVPAESDDQSLAQWYAPGVADVLRMGNSK